MIRTVQRRTRDAFLVVIAVPVLLGVGTFWLDQRNNQDVAWVWHTRDVLSCVNRILLGTHQAEGDQRGFLLTASDTYARQYRAHVAQVWDEFKAFQHLTADNPVQQANYERLAQLWKQRVRRMDEVLALRRTRQFQPSRIPDVLENGRQLTTAIDQLAQRMRQEEDRLLIIRSRKAHRTETEVAVLFAAGVLVNIALLTWAYGLIKNYGIARDRAEAEIRSANAELESRVRDRTAELEYANQRLVRSNEDLTRFAYIASHDLQEPLRTVGSYAGLLARRYQSKLDEQADKYIRFIVDGAKRMQNLVQDLLAYSRTGTEQLQFTRVDLNEVVATVEQDLKLAIAETGARITTEDLPVVEADGSKLQLVVQNLISNGIKFREPGRTPAICVAAKRSGPEWIISVQDNGIGFESQYAERIFVIFQRLHQLGAYPGTGIGLAICKRIVEGHGGRIWAESEPGKGSTFSFSLTADRRSRSESVLRENKVPESGTVRVGEGRENSAG